jgi:DNA-binding transcriptional LysR family regulator
MSATAVSNAIAGLESRLETRLFNRTTRSVALTDAGQRYVARVGPALQEIRLAGEEIHSDTGEPAGTLRLNVPNHIGSLFLDQLLIDFMIRYPKMRVEIVSEARMIDIVAEGYDAGIRLEESIPQDRRTADRGDPPARHRHARLLRTSRHSANAGRSAATSGDRHAYGSRRDLPLGAGPSGKRTRLPCRRALRRPIFSPRSAP